MGVRAVLCLGLVSGCYAELGGGWMPSVHDTTTVTNMTTGVADSTHTSSSGWTITFNLGVYLDTPLPVPLPYFPPWIGAGVSPLNANALVTHGDVPRSSSNGSELRVDVGLPIEGGEGVSFNATGAYGWLNKASIKEKGQSDYRDAKGDGNSWFLGATIAVRTEKGALNQLSFGVQHIRSVSVEKTAIENNMPAYEFSGTGIQMRYMIAWTPEGTLFRNGYDYHAPQEQSHNDCHPVTTTSSDGTKTTRNECY